MIPVFIKKCINLVVKNKTKQNKNTQLRWTKDLKRLYKVYRWKTGIRKRCSTLLFIREMQIKTIMKYQFQFSSVIQSCPTL